MDIHPWTRYEVARLRDEERLRRARQAAIAADARLVTSNEQPPSPLVANSWIGRLRRRHIAIERSPARSGAA